MWRRRLRRLRARDRAKGSEWGVTILPAKATPVSMRRQEAREIRTCATCSICNYLHL